MKMMTSVLEKAMNSMDLEKVSKIMEKFEKNFENLDVQSSVLDQSMSSATTLTIPTDQVETLIKQVAEENGLEIMGQLPSVSTEKPISIAAADSNRSRQQEDSLNKR
ncbi:unnamed protein product [Gordionus sp. m RMFG-2023]